jgi:hypothetical protein
MIKLFELNSEEIAVFKVKNPHKLIIFGYFLSIKGFRYLKPFNVKSLNDQLKS